MPSTSDKQKQIEIIIKLLRKSEDRGATPAESQAFAAKAYELMAKHNIVQAQVNLSYNQAPVYDFAKEQINVYQETVSCAKNKRDLLAVKLASILSRYFNCSFAYYTGENLINFYGARHRLPLLKYLFTRLYNEVTLYSDKEYRRLYNLHRKTGQTKLMRNWKHSFKAGFLVGLYKRLQEEQEKTRQHEVVPGVTYALVVQDELNALTQYLNDNYAFGPNSNIPLHVHNISGLRAGKLFAHSVSLNTPLPEPD